MTRIFGFLKSKPQIPKFRFDKVQGRLQPRCLLLPVTIYYNTSYTVAVQSFTARWKLHHRPLRSSLLTLLGRLQRLGQRLLGSNFLKVHWLFQQEETANPKDTVSIVSSKCFSKKANYLRNSVLRIMVP